MERYDSIYEFLRKTRSDGRFNLSNKEIDDYLNSLSGQMIIRERKDHSVEVFRKDDYSDKYRSQTNYHRNKYGKLSASIKLLLIRQFSWACKTLGEKQVDILNKTIVETVARAELYSGKKAPMQYGAGK